MEPVGFYFAKDWDEIQKMKGLDYYLGMGNFYKPQGRVNTFNRILFSGAGNEWYPHEIYIYTFIPPLKKPAFCTKELHAY